MTHMHRQFKILFISIIPTQKQTYNYQGASKYLAVGVLKGFRAIGNDNN